MNKTSDKQMRFASPAASNQVTNIYSQITEQQEWNGKCGCYGIYYSENMYTIKCS
jgi:hypothetical protein